MFFLTDNRRYLLHTVLVVFLLLFHCVCQLQETLFRKYPLCLVRIKADKSIIYLLITPCKALIFPFEAVSIGKVLFSILWLKRP